MSQRNFQLESTATRATDPAWPWIALLLTLALIGLTHDLGYATAFGAESAEAGRYFENQAEFQADVANAGMGRKLGFVCLLSVGLYCVVTTPRGHRFERSLLSFLIGVGLLWTLSSVLWSVQPQQTMRELVRLFAYLFVAAALALRFAPRSLCLLLTTTLIASVTFSVGIEFVTGGFRPWVPDYRLGGSMHSAALGVHAMLIVLASYALALRQRSRFWWGIFIAAVCILLLSKALTSLIACTVGIAAIHLLGMSRRYFLLGTGCAATFVAAALLVTSATDFWSAFRAGNVDTMGRDYDFTSFNGRIPLWTILCEKLEGKWLQGFGYAGFWVTKNIEALNDELNWYASHAHSVYLGTVVHVGLVGLFLLLAVVVLAFRRTIQRIRTIGAPEFYVFGSWFAAAFVISIAETAFSEPRDIALCAAAMVFSCIVSYQSEKVAVAAPALVRTPKQPALGGQFA